MAAFRGASITFALLAVVIGSIALFSSPAITDDFWSDDPYDGDWCDSCKSAGNLWSCQWICGGDHQGDYLCDVYSYFQIQPECWTDCGAPCHSK